MGQIQQQQRYSQLPHRPGTNMGHYKVQDQAKVSGKAAGVDADDLRRRLNVVLSDQGNKRDSQLYQLNFFDATRGRSEIPVPTTRGEPRTTRPPRQSTYHDQLAVPRSEKSARYSMPAYKSESTLGQARSSRGQERSADPPRGDRLASSRDRLASSRSTHSARSMDTETDASRTDRYASSRTTPSHHRSCQSFHDAKPATPGSRSDRGHPDSYKSLPPHVKRHTATQSANAAIIQSIKEKPVIVSTSRQTAGKQDQPKLVERSSIIVPSQTDRSRLPTRSKSQPRQPRYSVFHDIHERSQHENNRSRDDDFIAFAKDPRRNTLHVDKVARAGGRSRVAQTNEHPLPRQPSVNAHRKLEKPAGYAGAVNDLRVDYTPDRSGTNTPGHILFFLPQKNEPSPTPPRSNPVAIVTQEKVRPTNLSVNVSALASSSSDSASSTSPTSPIKRPKTPMAFFSRFRRQKGNKQGSGQK